MMLETAEESDEEDHVKSKGFHMQVCGNSFGLHLSNPIENCPL